MGKLEKNQQNQIFESLLSMPVDTKSGVKVFLDSMKRLGPTISPFLLDRLRPKNFGVLDTLQTEFARKQPKVEEGRITIIIPATVNEREIGGILTDITNQVAEIKDQGKIKSAEFIITVNGATHENSETAQQVKEISKRFKSCENITISLFHIRQQGKLVAFDKTLDMLEARKKFPEKIFFFDADARLLSGGLDEMLYQLEQANAVGARIANQEATSRYANIATLSTKNHGQDENKQWLHGGAFAMNSDVIALYHAYVHAFPGTIMNDVNWTLLLRSWGVHYHLTDNEYLILSPPETFPDLLKQQDRWIKGLEQGIAFNEYPEKIANLPSVLAMNELRAYLNQYFPKSSHITAKEIADFFDGYIRTGQMWEIPFFHLLVFFANYFKKPKEIPFKGGKKISVGGPPPNPYYTKGWSPPREQHVGVAKTEVGRSILKARKDGFVEFNGIKRKVTPGTGFYTIIGQGHSKVTKARYFHEALNIHYGLDQMHMTPYEIVNFKDMMDDVVGLDMRGVTVTVPMKEIAHEYIKTHGKFGDERARKAGAINTIVNTPKGLVGWNTDMDGFKGASEAVGIKLKGISAAVIGSGGMGRAAIASLGEGGAKIVRIFDIDLEKADRAAEEFRKKYPQTQFISVGKVEDSLVDSDCYIIQCSAVGTNSDESPVPAELIKPTMSVIDAVHSPLVTRLLRDAKKAGCSKIITSLGIISYGGEKQIQYYLGSSIIQDHPGEIVEIAEQAILDAFAKTET